MGKLTEQDAEKYFADREAHGFNTAGWVGVACAGRDFPDDKDGSTADECRPRTKYRVFRADCDVYRCTSKYWKWLQRQFKGDFSRRSRAADSWGALRSFIAAAEIRSDAFGFSAI